MTPREFFGRLEGYRKSEKAKYKEAWERTRIMTSKLLNIHLPQKEKIPAEKLMPFSWDKKQKLPPPKPMTERDKKMMDFWDKQEKAKYQK